MPYLQAGKQVIQGSENIIDWAEKQPNDKVRRLTPDADREPYREPYRQIEKRFDDIAGVHVRRYYYSEALVEHPTYSKMTHPPRLAGDVSAWMNRPSLTWVRAIYCRHR